MSSRLHPTGKETTQRIGALAEDWALNHLQNQGLKLIKRNFRCRGGEIDLVMREASYLVFVEVRYRSRSDFGGAAASITGAKQRRLLIAARYYLAINPAWSQAPIRFDVLALTGSVDAPNLEWIKDAIHDRT
jgi:putative endonuclease